MTLLNLVSKEKSIIDEALTREFMLITGEAAAASHPGARLCEDGGAADALGWRSKVGGIGAL